MLRHQVVLIASLAQSNMKMILETLDLDYEQKEQLQNKLDKIGVAKVEKFVYLLNKYRCDISFIREIVLNSEDILTMDSEKLEYTIEAIVANDDIIEETLLDIL